MEGAGCSGFLGRFLSGGWNRAAQRVEYLHARAPVRGLQAQALLLKHDGTSRQRADHAIGFTNRMATGQQQLLQLLALAATQPRICLLYTSRCV